MEACDSGVNHNDETQSALNILRSASPEDQHLFQALNILAEASRNSQEIREALGAPEKVANVLRFISYRLTRRDSAAVLQTALRCLGNACIDNDSARAHVAEQGFPWATALLVQTGDEPLRGLTALVLYNICSGHNEAQTQAYNEGLHLQLITLLFEQTQGARLAGDASSSTYRTVELLFWLALRHADAETKVSVAGDRLDMLLTLLTDNGTAEFDLDAWAELYEAALCFLRDPMVQKEACERHLDAKFWSALESNERRIQDIGREQAETEGPDGEDVKLLVSLSASFTWVLSDLSALPIFVEHHPNMRDDALLVRALAHVEGDGVDWERLNQHRLINAAYQVIGNYVLGLEPHSCESLSTQDHLQQAILKTMAVYDDADLLHSAAGLLTLLSRPSVAAREAIGGEHDAAGVLQKLSGHTSPELKQDGLRLIKALGRDCTANQRRYAELARGLLVDLASDR